MPGLSSPFEAILMRVWAGDVGWRKDGSVAKASAWERLGVEGRGGPGMGASGGAGGERIAFMDERGEGMVTAVRVLWTLGKTGGGDALAGRLLR